MLNYLVVILVIIALIPIFILATGVLLTIYGVLNSGLIEILLELSNFTYSFMSQNIGSIGLVDYSIGFIVSATVLGLYIYANFYAFSNEEDNLKFKEKLNASAITSIFIVTAIRYSSYSVEKNSFEVMIKTYRGLILLLPLLTIIVLVKDYYKNYNPEIPLKKALKGDLIESYFLERVNQNTLMKPFFAVREKWSAFLVFLIIIFSSSISSYFIEKNILQTSPKSISYILIAIMLISAILGVAQYSRTNETINKKNRRIDEFY